MLWPTINPDGQQMVAEWYMKNVGTPYELSGLPRLYQEYVGHDNNRDAYMLNMIESRVLEHTWRQWEPQIIYVHHQSGPFPTRIWLPPFSEPVGIDAPFIMSREVNMIGMAIAKGLEEHGQVGATHMGTAFDAWYPGYVDYAPNFKNIAAFWTETALFQYATPHDYTIGDFPPNMRDLRPQSLYSSPWPPGTWRLRDAVDYMETASLSVLEFASKYKDSLLYDRYQAGRDQIALGKKKAPYAYFIPQQQRDPVAAVEMLRRIAFGGVRVSTLTAPVTIGADTFPAGTWVIPTDQEFAAMAREVLDVQTYPDLRQYPGGPPERPYDAAGWSLPLQMGVRVVAAASPLTDRDARGKMKRVGAPPEPRVKPTAYEPALQTDAAPFDSLPGVGFNTDPASAAIVPLPGHISRAGSVLLVDPRRTTRSRRSIARGSGRDGAGERRRVGRADSVHAARALDAARRTISCSRCRCRRNAPSRRQGVRCGSRASACISRGPGAWTKAGPVGCSSSTASRSSPIHPEDFKSPLAQKVDVLIMADDARVPVAVRRRAAADAAVRAARAIRPEYAYQLTASDLQGFEQFVRGGGTLVCLSNASAFAIQQFKLPVTERRRRSAAGRVLPARIDRRSHDRPDASGDGRHAGQGRGVRRRQPGLRDAGWLQGHGARALSGVGIAAAVRIPHRREVSAGKGGGARRPARRGPRRASRIQARVARPAVRHVPGVVQRGAVRPLGVGLSKEERMGRTLIRAMLVMGWIPTIALMMGANWMTGALAFAQGPTPVKVTRLYTGSDGKTKIEEYEIPLKPQGKGTDLSPTVGVKSLQFRRTNKDYDLDWHPAPNRQYVVTLSGESEIELEGGRKVRLGPGHILLAEDTTGQGHISRAIGAGDRISLFIPLADGAVAPR